MSQTQLLGVEDPVQVQPLGGTGPAKGMVIISFSSAVASAGYETNVSNITFIGQVADTDTGEGAGI